jgi:hypothetical protein
MEPDNNEILSNAGRCDLCGEPIDMRDSGDSLALWEPTEEGESDEWAEAIARALRRSNDDVMTLDLADLIEERGMLDLKVHQSCLDETGYAEMAAGSRIGTEYETDEDRELLNLDEPEDRE